MKNKKYPMYRLMTEERVNGDVWYTPQCKLSWLGSWQNIYRTQTGGYDWSTSLQVSHRSEEDALNAIRGMKTWRAGKLGKNTANITYKYL